MKIQKMAPLSQQVILPRNCGSGPVAGGIYASVATGFSGVPTWNFLIDPVWQLPDGFGMCDQGMQLRERYEGGQIVRNRKGQIVYDVWDHIGSGSYPNPSDWFLEVDKLGFHQLLPRDMQFERITPETYYIATHDRAHVIETWEFYEKPVTPEEYPLCPKNIEAHVSGKDVIDMCPRLWWEGLVKGDGPRESRSVIRHNASFEYRGYRAPEGVSLTYSEGAFFSFPMGQMLTLLVYEDPDTNKHELALKELESLSEELQNVKFVPLD